MKEFWEQKFNTKDYIYGKEPNRYLAEKLSNISPKRILFPAEGEGRNAVYAATKGWQVEAFDLSEIAKEKALKYAKELQVSINYTTASFLEISYKSNSFDAVALIYAHFAADKKETYFQKITQILKHNGVIIFEGFGQKHPTYQEKYPHIGGPKDKELLFSVEELKTTFSNFEFLELQEKEIELSEGKKHIGKGSVVRMFAKKK
ncbi:Methyltransferase domain-containing protein [Mesonia phycicola]|uniref:Methyltransferase domain-containing protein n=1 Tax=Mesonia phycicola TaxID=579105 RepID=A0A1M6C0I2_9FLAO|nr:class I SAM-dependent methyltransferase [Mesonia phycicola]SHI54381.1 Methyltransferase domain-containing protein [Mesonia phycicola]